MDRSKYLCQYSRPFFILQRLFPLKTNIMKNPLKNKIIVVLVIFVSLLVLSTVFLFLLFTPKFPETVPSAEKLNVRNESYKTQVVFFNKFTRYLRDNHGGIVEAEEINKNFAVSGEKGYSFVVFRHRYKFFNKALILKLIKNYAQQEEIAYQVKKYSHTKNNDQQPETYKVEFLVEKNPWVSVMLEPAVEYLQQAKQSIQYTESTEFSQIDQDEPVNGPPNSAKLVVIIDDLGNNMIVFNKLIQLDYNINYSILPQLPHSLETAEKVHQMGRDIMLHQPMEPKDWPKYNPGLGALMINDSMETIYQKMEMNLQTVPYIVGVNNHMGSAYTQHAKGLDILMGILYDRNLFFLDSKTAPGRIAQNSAKKKNVTYFSRNIFLDNIQNNSSTKEQLYKAVAIAKKRGRAIAIGHPYLTTFNVLQKHLPLIEEQGVQIVKVSDLLDHY